MSHTKTDYAREQTGTANLTESERHRLLAAERRRLALDALSERSNSVDLADLAAEVAAREYAVDATDEKSVERVTVSLHHTHLPILDELGVASYDPDSHTVTL